MDTIEHASGYALALARLGGDPFADEPDARLVRRLAEATVRAGVTLVPTFATLAGFAGDLDPRGLPHAAREDDEARGFRAGWTHLRGLPGTAVRAARADRRLARALVREVLDLGGRVAAGTDSPAAPDTWPGGSLHFELAQLVSCGLTPLGAIRAATDEAARVLRRDDLGVLRAGAAADLLVVPGRPNGDLASLRTPLAVVVSGRLTTSRETSGAAGS